ncbi:MAG TPA: hypothetical protein VK495_11665 [Steroidobacteraceae bacterium]|nr:hypothetical protein [Steroidobacteraceae bacterium]
MMTHVRQRLHARSTALLMTIETGLPRIMIGWLVVAALASALRVAASPLHGTVPVTTLLPYLLLVLAPLGSMVLALRWFADGDRLAQPETRFARVLRWTDVSRETAMRHPLYGTSGIMVSLLVGMLLNVPVRGAEYLASMPALAGPIPHWLQTLHTLMTLDVVLLSSLYAIAFVAALRRVPLFPRLLVAIWMIDLAMQMVTARMVAGTPGLPVSVAAPLQLLLDGNVKKVLISIGLWLPYLLLSARVNVTYRHRIAD